MAVEKGKQVSIEYTLKIDEGEVVDTNVDSTPLTYVQGARQILPALENTLEGLEVGETKAVSIRPDEGFGERSEEAFQEVDKIIVPEEARKVDVQLQGRDNDGNTVNVRVAEVKDDTVVLDLNHPLAGKTLHFDVKVVDVQEAAT